MAVPPLFAPASDVAFGIVFGVFVAATAVLAVVTIVWAVRRDRSGRETWRQRMIERTEAPGTPGPGAGRPHQRGAGRPRQRPGRGSGRRPAGGSDRSP